MFFKKKRKFYSITVPEVSKVCATCKYVSTLHATDKLFCSKNGPVSEDYSCKKYSYNRLMKRIRPKRQFGTDKFSADDFNID